MAVNENLTNVLGELFNVCSEIGVWLPISPIASSLGFKPLPSLYWPLLALTLLCYVFLTQGVKVWLLRKAWI